MNEPPALGRDRATFEAELASLLRAAGVAQDQIDDAASAGLLPLLAVETQALGEAHYDIDEVAERAGVGVDRIRVLWGALGLASPRSGERIFNDTDVEQLAAVAALVDSGVADPEVVIQLTRVLGSSMARIASSQVELLVNQPDPGELALADGADWFGDTFSDILGQVWRRHLQAAARSRLTGPLTGDVVNETPPLVVGFADLVGFTALSQQLDSAALASVVDQFESVAFATIGVHGGRVVKMIGDEVMFAIDEPVAAARCALDLSESYHAADDLSDVRVGLAFGAVIDRDGDLFGPPVNLASRITAIAYPGSVVIDDELRQLLAGRGVHVPRHAASAAQAHRPHPAARVAGHRERARGPDPTTGPPPGAARRAVRRARALERRCRRERRGRRARRDHRDRRRAPNLPTPRAADRHSTTTSSSPSSGSGYDRSSASRVSTRILLTARLRYHLWSAGTTYHGAAAVEVAPMANA